MELVSKLDFWNQITSELNVLQNEQYYKYYQIIHEQNKYMNLTGIDDLEGVYLKHFYDCLSVRKLIVKLDLTTIADLGSGAGFPGLVLAIYFPKIKFTLIEPIKKRANFLNDVIKSLKLKNVIVLNKRAEEISEKFDLVIMRAVSQLNILLEISVNLIEENGYFCAMKGPKLKIELQCAKKAMSILKYKEIKIEEFVLPIENSHHYNLLLKKEKYYNSNYPRNYGQIKKNPL